MRCFFRFFHPKTSLMNFNPYSKFLKPFLIQSHAKNEAKNLCLNVFWTQPVSKGAEWKELGISVF